MENNNQKSSQYLIFNNRQYTVIEFEEEINSIEEEVRTAKDSIRIKEKDLIAKKTVLREDTLIQQFDKFKIRRPQIVQEAVYLNKGLLRLVVGSYYDDIHRYKDYSSTKWANNHKQAAYTIKWIVKFKPVQIREKFDHDDILNNEILDINLHFALICGFTFLDRKIIDLIYKENREVDNGNQSFYNKLLYTLRFRPFTGKQLISMFEALEMNVKGSETKS
jgi:hypothetical protein